MHSSRFERFIRASYEDVGFTSSVKELKGRENRTGGTGGMSVKIV
jgi:hypothetical protein